MALYVVNDDAGFGAITATADEAITAGQFVKWTSTGGEITPNTTDPSAALTVAKCDASGDELIVAGIALTDFASGGIGTIATRGWFLLEAGAAITGGTRVQKEDGTDPLEITDLADATINNAHIGKSYTACNAADEFVLVHVVIS